MSVHPNVPKIVKLITSKIRTMEDKREEWAAFKRENARMFSKLLMLEHTTFDNPGSLINFDIDDERQLILLNYTGQAHNALHHIDGGWTVPLRQMRGIIYDFSVEEPVLVSRSFAKFFNYNELPETTTYDLKKRHGDGKFVCREKADGHMVQYFVHQGELCSSTRGKFDTVTADIANNMLALSDFQDIERATGKQLMSLVVELVHPETKVHVDYDNAERLYLLTAFDSDGKKLDLSELNHICETCPQLLQAPSFRELTVDEIASEVLRREVKNHEGWVADFNGELVKFKYIDYIGLMVQRNLSYKYIMNCIKSDRLDKMLFTLPEEVRDTAYSMVETLNKVAAEAVKQNDHKILYNLHSVMEGGTAYFRTVCRRFFKFMLETA